MSASVYKINWDGTINKSLDKNEIRIIARDNEDKVLAT